MTDAAAQLRLYTLPEAIEFMTGEPATPGEIQRLMRRLRAREVPGHRDGRTWKMTLGDIQTAIESMAVPAVVAQPDPAGLTRTSRRRLSHRGGAS